MKGISNKPVSILILCIFGVLTLIATEAALAKRVSSTQQQLLREGCVGTIFTLSGGGWACYNADGKYVVCIPNSVDDPSDSTWNCWVTREDISSQQGSGYQVAGISCVPSSQTIDESSYVTQSGNVRFKPNKAGVITLFCPITSVPSFVLSDGILMLVLLRDGDGHEENNRLSVNLRRLDRSSGQITDHPDAQLNSNRDCGHSSIDWQECAVSSTTLLTNQYYYFFQVTLQRKSAEENVWFGGIRLAGIEE